MDRDSPHLPHAAPIDAYRGGGFRFAGMSHRGSLLCLPDGMWASRVSGPQDIDATALRLVLEIRPAVELCLIGAGRDPWMAPPALRALCRQAGFAIEGMATPAAVHTYNILVEEKRRVAALLIALD